MPGFGVSPDGGVLSCFTVGLRTIHDGRNPMSEQTPEAPATDAPQTEVEVNVNNETPTDPEATGTSDDTTADEANPPAESREAEAEGTGSADDLPEGGSE